MPATSFSVNCPICDRTNLFSAADDKIIDCRDCSAPIYNDNRPANTTDLIRYQTLLSKWGEEFRQLFRQLTDSLKSELDNLKSEHEQQLSMSQSEAETIREKLKVLKNKHTALQSLHERELKEQSDRLQTEIAVAKKNYKALQQSIEQEQLSAQPPPSHLAKVNHPSSSTAPAQSNSLIAETAFVQLYNQNDPEIERRSTPVNQTAASLRSYFEISSDAVQLEENESGKYWIVPQNIPQDETTADYYLVPKKDIQLNQHSIPSVKACFGFANKMIPNSMLVMLAPAVVKAMEGRVSGRSQWTLIQRGKLKFVASKISDLAPKDDERLPKIDSQSTPVEPPTTKVYDIATIPEPVSKEKASSAPVKLPPKPSVKSPAKPITKQSNTAVESATNAYNKYPYTFRRLNIFEVSPQSGALRRSGELDKPIFVRSPQSRGSYCIVTQDQKIHYIVLKDDKISFYNFMPSHVAYIYSIPKEADLLLQHRYKKLAQVEKHDDDQWILTNLGELEFY